MMNAWPLVSVGNILIKSDAWIDLKPDETYKEVTVRLWGKGVTLRREVNGTGIAAERRIAVKKNQFILSRIDARNGAFGLIPDFLDGGVVSTDFPVFTVNDALILPAYLNWMSKTADFVDLCKAASEGTTNRVRLKEDRFLAMEVPLPPLDEQRRIVARIEALAAKIEEARGLRQRSMEEADAFKSSSLDAEFKQLEGKHPYREIQEVCDVVRGGSPRPAGSPIFYGGDIPFIKIGDITKDDGKFLYEAESSVNELGRKQSRYISENTLMLTNSGATLGVPKITKIAGCFNDGSQAFLNLSDDVFIEYLYYFFKSRTQWFRESPARGQGQPNLNTDMIKPLKFPCPPLEEQRRIVAYLDGLQAKVDALKQLQSQTRVEIDALLPSVLDKAFKGEL